jgi:hypothetical protein
MLTDRCIYTIKHSDDLRKCLASGGRDKFSEGRKWGQAKKLVDEAKRNGNRVPVIFAPAEQTGHLFAWALLDDVDVRGEGSTYAFSELTRFKPRPLKTTLRKASNGERLERMFIRPYAICKTPKLLVRLWANRAKSDDGAAAAEQTALIEDAPIAEDLREIENRDIGPTMKDALSKARLGQGKIRQDVLRLWNNRCAVTGSETDRAITASHIKPWRESTDKQRLDPRNGIPLLASLHALLDEGLISFEPLGRMIVSSKLSNAEREIFGIVEATLRKNPQARTAGYLAWHRRRKFKK